MCLVCGCTQVSGDYLLGTAQQRLASSVAAPRGDDGRPASIVVEEQAPWGWGLAPAQPLEPVARALTDLPSDPAGYSARQQDATRRDIAERLGSYLDYEPVPWLVASD
jgi:hypothetical protein